MSKLLLLLFPLLGSIVLSGCSQESLPDTSQEHTYMAFGIDSVGTRGAVTTRDNIAEFGVFCFNTGLANWADVMSTITPNKMFNQRVVRGTQQWSYEPPVKWEAGDGRRHTFFGYSPRATADNQVSLTTAEATPGVPALQFEALEEVGNQVDLLVSTPHYNLLPVDKVRMSFQHALTKVGFKAYSAAAGTFIEKIEFTNICYKGSCPMVTPVVWSIETDRRNFTIDYGGGVPVMGDVNNLMDVSAASYYLMTVPQSWKNNSTAKITIYYRQAGISQPLTVEYTIGSKTDDAEWPMGKEINYVLNLGGTPNSDLVVKEVIIADWQMASTYNEEWGAKGELYWLRFDANGGSGPLPQDTEIESGTLYKIPSDTPTPQVGYSFKEWNTAKDGSGTSYQPGTRVPIDNAAVTLYAQYSPDPQP